QATKAIITREQRSLHEVISPDPVHPWVQGYEGVRRQCRIDGVNRARRTIGAGRRGEEGEGKKKTDCGPGREWTHGDFLRLDCLCGGRTMKRILQSAWRVRPPSKSMSPFPTCPGACSRARRRWRTDCPRDRWRAGEGGRIAYLRRR